MSFDVDAYRRSVSPVRTDDIDFSAFERRPLDEGSLRTIRYMHDIESHTVCYLRDLLMTRSHADPRVTTFLTMWAYEEYWHGVALGEVLRAHGEPAEDERLAPMRARLQGWKDKVAPYLSAIGSAALGDDFVAVHMTWGAVNEWSTQQGYDRLAARADHPVLTELLGRIAQQESRHIAFYASEARTRLSASSRAQKATRFALQRLWAPVGSGAVPAAETEFVIQFLFSGVAGLEAADRIDRHVDRLPGLQGLGLLRGAVEGIASGGAGDASIGRARRRLATARPEEGSPGIGERHQAA
jgi:rubrerythrin